MTTLKIIWPVGGFVDRVLSRVFSKMAEAAGQKNQGSDRIHMADFLTSAEPQTKRVAVVLPSETAFFDVFDARTNSQDDQFKILQHERERFNPTQVDDSVLIARQAMAESNCVEIICVRSDLLTQIELKCEALGIDELELSPEHAPDICVPAPRNSEQRRNSRKLSVLAFSLLVFGAWSVLSGLADRSTRQLEDTARAERNMRTALLNRLEADQTLGSLGELGSSRPDRKSPQGRLQTLSQITTATSDNTWWQVIEMGAVGTRLSGQSGNAASSLKAISSAFPGAEVSFAETVSDANERTQTFVIYVQWLEGGS